MTAELNRRVKYLAYSIELLILFVVQGLGTAPILGVRPVLILAALVTISLLEPELPSLFFGLAGGFLLDIGAGGAIGIGSIVCAVMCCLISVMIQRKIHVTMLSAMLTGALALGIMVALEWLLRFVAAGYSLPLFALLNNYIPRYFYTLLLVPLAYLLNLGLYMGLKTAEE